MENVIALDWTKTAEANNSYSRDVEQIMLVSDRKQSVVPVVLFVLTTIQAGLSTCKDQIADVNKLGSKSRFMWGKKGDGLDYAKKHDAFLYGKIKHIKKQWDWIALKLVQLQSNCFWTFQI